MRPPQLSDCRSNLITPLQSPSSSASLSLARFDIILRLCFPLIGYCHYSFALSPPRHHSLLSVITVRAALLIGGSVARSVGSPRAVYSEPVSPLTSLCPLLSHSYLVAIFRRTLPSYPPANMRQRHTAMHRPQRTTAAAVCLCHSSTVTRQSVHGSQPLDAVCCFTLLLHLIDAVSTQLVLLWVLRLQPSVSAARDVQQLWQQQQHQPPPITTSMTKLPLTKQPAAFCTSPSTPLSPSRSSLTHQPHPPPHPLHLLPALLHGAADGERSCAAVSNSAVCSDACDRDSDAFVSAG